jgi:murein DD-endopeptidase MepM/ murein hydrolase activator NlpD
MAGSATATATAVGSVGQQDGQAIRLVPAAPVELSGYQWPLPRGRITLPFGPWPDASRIVDGKPFHDGLDLATFCGDRIVAAHDGVVVAAGRRYDSQMGWIGDLRPYFDRLDAKSLWVTLPIVVVIDDGNGYRSIYAHFGRIAVERGQTVRAGQLLGQEGQTGHASGCHLHYGLFSPEASGRFGIDPAIVEHLKLPAWEIGRVDPLLVLPQRTSSSPAPSATPTPRVGFGVDPSD